MVKAKKIQKIFFIGNTPFLFVDIYKYSTNFTCFHGLDKTYSIILADYTIIDVNNEDICTKNTEEALAVS
jgi:hypothetical protein